MKTLPFLAPLLRRDAVRCTLATARGAVVASSVEAAFDSASRKKGLLGRERFDEGAAIVIAPCNAIHTFFMRFPIDVVHVDREGRVLKATRALRPWRVDGCLRGHAVVELPQGTIERCGVGRGDILTLAPSESITT